MKKILKKVNETGTLLVEAMAMLGLIAMVTPVLYKKASERTVELQDVNASSQLRALSTAIDGYLKDNFARITKGEKITNSNNNEADFGSFKDAEEGQLNLSISHFSDYLPYGFLNDDGTPRETKIFDDEYHVIIKLESDIKNVGGVDKVMSQTLTGFVTASPKNSEEVGKVRASRIASMIGSNGGYVMTESSGQVAMGAQGIWSVPTSDLGVTLADNSFVVSSVQPISSQGLANEDVLHRKNEPDMDDELNTMETDLFMGYNLTDTKNIRLVNQIIMHPDESRMVGGTDVASDRTADDLTAIKSTLEPGGYKNTLDKALYIAKGGGAYMEGALQAMNSLFTVKEDGIKYYGKTGGTTDPVTGTTTPVTRATDPILKIDGTELVYGDPGAGKAKLTVKSAGSMTFGTSAVPANGTTPAQPAGESLYADKDKFRAGDGNLNVIKDGTDWYTVIKKDAAGNATAHDGSRNTYTWNGAVPTEDATKKTGKYEVSINGSAFVKDTMLTGKLKSFNVDAATLRAGVDPNDFDGATEDTDFYTVAKMDRNIGGSFIVGTNEFPMMTISDGETTDNTGRVIPGGVSISTADALDGAKGVDISAGASKLIYYDTDEEEFKWSDAPEDNLVRIGGIGGVNISARNDAGRVTEAPVSIQGEMFRAFKSGGYNTITTHTQQFNMLSKWLYDSYSDEQLLDPEAFGYYRYSPGSWGRVYMADSGFIIAGTSGNPIVDIAPVASSGATSRFIGSLAVYNSGFDPRRQSDIGTSDTFTSTSSAYGAAAGMYVNNGLFQIRSHTKKYATTDIEYERNTYRSDKVQVFTVDAGGANTNLVDNADRLSKNGSVYIRRGSMALESNVDETNNRKLTNAVINTQYGKGETDAVGYIAADRFISHYKPGTNTTLNAGVGEAHTANAIKNGRQNGLVAYDGYEVNPAYTSVMHDIKLTTRGGARLSDVLPDFINKGIYVVDTTYKPGTAWTPNSPGIPSTEWDNNDATNEVSPYAGFIPTPKCPPGYGKSITLTPAGWNMAEAGRAKENGGIVDIVTPKNVYDVIRDPTDPTEDSREPLYFQKSTWLKSMVLPYCGGKFTDGQCDNSSTFKGWGAIMGFIYPGAYWLDSIDAGDDEDIQTVDTNTIYWNLFPVYYRQLEGYATVYCYFDRDSFRNTDEVDYTYDQLYMLNNHPGNLNSHEKGYSRGYYYTAPDGSTTEVGVETTVGDAYRERLNDPKLKYNDPW